MPSWACPFCEAEMTVKPALMGATRPCPKCGQESVITEMASRANVTQPKPPVQASPRPRSDAASVAISESLASESLMSAMLVRGLLILAAIGGVSSFFLDTGPGTGIAILVAVTMSWPLTTIAEESYRTRRLLQELLKK